MKEDFRFAKIKKLLKQKAARLSGFIVLIIILNGESAPEVIVDFTAGIIPHGEQAILINESVVCPSGFEFVYICSDSAVLQNETFARDVVIGG